MKVSVGDRLILLSVLPQEGNLTTIRIVRELKSALSFSEDEHKTLGFREEGEKVFWDNTLPDIDVPIGEKAADIIVNAFKELDRHEKVREEYIPLYEKFVEGLGSDK